MKTKDPLAEKRKRLAQLIAHKNAERLRLMAENWAIDVNPSNFERLSDAKRLERGIARMGETQLDELLAYHDPQAVGPRYVW